MALRSEDDELYDAFRRHDKYGRMGMEPQPWTEYVRLGLLSLTVVPFKMLGTFVAVLSFWIVCWLATLLPPKPRSVVVAELGKLHCRVCLFFLGFVNIRFERVESSNKSSQKPAPAGIISNHSSWADILLAMRFYFPSFVAKASTKKIPLIGIISQLMGCIYVDREIQSSDKTGVSGKVKQRMKEVSEGSDQTLRPVLLFPEGTTTNGSYLLKFRTGAFIAGEPLLPILIEYSKEDTVSMSYETIHVFRHLFLVMANPLHRVTVYELPVYVPSAEEKINPQLYAENMHKYMLQYSGYRPSPATYHDKKDMIRIMQSSPPPAHKKAD